MSAHVPLGASTHVIILRHSLSLTSHIHMYERASTFSSWSDISRSVLSADSNSSKWTRANWCRWPSVRLGWYLCYATQLICHQGRPLLYPQCGRSILFWGVKCFCWVKKAVSGWKPVLGRELVNYKQLMLRRGATLWLICGELEKPESWKCLKAGRQLSELGNSSAALADVIQ